MVVFFCKGEFLRGEVVTFLESKNYSPEFQTRWHPAITLDL